MEFTGERYVPQLTETQIKIEHLQRYLSITELVKGKVVLDAACGEGYGSSILSDTADKVLGIDISEETIKHASSTYKKDNLSFQIASIENLPFPDHSVDVVVSFETIEHVNETLQNSFLSEIKRVLKPDGLLIISTPNKHVYSDLRNYQNPFHIKEFYKDEFIDLLNNFFAEVKIFHQKNEVASVITGLSQKEYILQEKLEQESTDVEGTYFIAICSEEEITNLTIGSSILFADKHIEMMNRILSLQDEVDDKNKHINYLNTHNSELSVEVNRIKGKLIEIQEKNINLYEKTGDLQDRLINALNEQNILKQEIEQQRMNNDEILRRLGLEYGIQNCDLEEVIKRVNQDIRKIENHEQEIQNKDQELHSKSQELLGKDQELKNKDGHITLLLESDRVLNNIFQSNGWKVLNKYYRFRDRVIPKKSKRKFVTKLVTKTIKEPRKMIKSFNKTNLNKLRYYLSTEDIGNIEDRIDHYMDRHKEADQFEIKLIDSNQTKDKIIFPQFEKPLVSIIIPVYNQWDYTYSCLKSISMNTDHIAFEIIIADDMSTDETTQISHYIENIHVVRDGVNRGFLLNCNNAARHAKGKYIFFLNNDTNVQEDWLKYLVDLVEKDSTIGMVGSKLVYPDGRLQEAGGIIWNDASGWNYGRLDDPSKPEYNYVKEVDYISGAAIMIRTDLWNEIGGFDERYVPAYFEDSDLAFEVRKHGHKVVFQPKSIVVHFEGISHGTDTSSGVKSYQVHNKEKFIEKWSAELSGFQFNNAQNVFQARDRSRLNKTILVIDHYVPHFDKDAGSRTVFQYLNLFRKLGFNVKFLGDNFFQHEPYTSELEKMGIEVLYGNWYSKHWKDWIKNNGEHIDFTFLNRPHISEKYIDTLKRYTNSKVIYYGHDLHYLRDLREYELSGNSKLLESSNEWKTKELELCRKADVAYFPSQVEVDELRKLIPELNVKAIPAYIYDDIQQTAPVFKDKQDLLFVGGFGHKPNIDAVKWFLEEIFPLILQKKGNIKFYIVGSNPPEEIVKYQSDNIIVTGFVSDDELKNYYNQCKIAVVPLRYGAGVKGKVVEALYHQIPVITTSIGAEGLPDIDNYLIINNDPSEFAETVLKLYGNELLLFQYSCNSYEYVQKYFSVESVLSTISSDFNIERKHEFDYKVKSTS